MTRALVNEISTFLEFYNDEKYNNEEIAIFLYIKI